MLLQPCERVALCAHDVVGQLLPSSLGDVPRARHVASIDRQLFELPVLAALELLTGVLFDLALTRKRDRKPSRSLFFCHHVPADACLGRESSRSRFHALY